MLAFQFIDLDMRNPGKEWFVLSAGQNTSENKNSKRAKSWNASRSGLAHDRAQIVQKCGYYAIHARAMLIAGGPFVSPDAHNLQSWLQETDCGNQFGLFKFRHGMADEYEIEFGRSQPPEGFLAGIDIGSQVACPLQYYGAYCHQWLIAAHRKNRGHGFQS
jgi:hypothetical protein